jgi:hypothetical protein
MDLVSVAKYESIADRIRRLGSQPKLSNSSNQPQHTAPAKIQPSPYIANHQKSEQFERYRPGARDRKVYARVTTQ